MGRGKAGLRRRQWAARLPRKRQQLPPSARSVCILGFAARSGPIGKGRSGSILPVRQPSGNARKVRTAAVPVGAEIKNCDEAFFAGKLGSFEIEAEA